MNEQEASAYISLIDFLEVESEEIGEERKRLCDLMKEGITKENINWKNSLVNSDWQIKLTGRSTFFCSAVNVTLYKGSGSSPLNLGNLVYDFEKEELSIELLQSDDLKETRRLVLFTKKIEPIMKKEGRRSHQLANKWKSAFEMKEKLVRRENNELEEKYNHENKNFY